MPSHRRIERPEKSAEVTAHAQRRSGTEKAEKVRHNTLLTIDRVESSCEALPPMELITSSKQLMGWFVRGELEIHFAKECLEARVSANWIKERIAPNRRHHRISLVDRAVHPRESFVKLAQS